VTLPYFEAQADRMIRQTGATFVALAPIVNSSDLDDWNDYSEANASKWIQQSFDYSEANPTTIPEVLPFIHRPLFPPLRASEPLIDDLYLPLWQVAPIADNAIMVNYDSLNSSLVPKLFETILQSRRPVLSEANLDTSSEETILVSFVAAPIFDSVGKKSMKDDIQRIVGLIIAQLSWTEFFVNLLPEGIDGINVVVRNACASNFTLNIHGPEVEFVGIGDLHDTQYQGLEMSTRFDIFENVEDCTHSIYLYPTSEFQDIFRTNRPVVYSIAAVAIFALAGLVFYIYDRSVQQRQRAIEVTARRSSAIVHSLFPENVRDRMMDDAADADEANVNQRRDSTGGFMSLSRVPSMANLPLHLPQIFSDLQPHLRSVAGLLPDLRRVNPMRLLEEISNLTMREQPQTQQDQPNVRRDDKPIADLFPNATVLFGDIAGFTAWSSERQPTQVFTLLETIYNSFDKIAKKRKVFKVETIGDCYMAATGLPQIRADHAVVMAGFARECMTTMYDVVRQLEVELGPDTADLTMRFGIHSGPVTAGVLRGEKSRFQLFGDTVNTASRMESTGEKDKIQLSEETAGLLIKAGMASWIEPREDLVEAKGKGKLQTYWLAVGTPRIVQLAKIPTSRLMVDGPLSGDSSWKNNSNENATRIRTEKIDRLIEWNVDVLKRFIKKIIAIRGEDDVPNGGASTPIDTQYKSGNLVDEVKESLTLPKEPKEYKKDPLLVELDPTVHQQLRDYVAAIAFLCDNNHFHSFEHCSHVTQSVTKMLARIVSPKNHDEDPYQDQSNSSSMLHKYTYGITSDPLTQFAVVFSALIHDVAHPGVPNAQLVKEGSELANKYRDKSAAEQNSVDIAWNMLMEPAYTLLRECLFTCQADLDRFRELVVNTVMATDIADKELSKLRQQRWEKAFRPTDNSEDEMMNLKASITIEHLIQASDVAHTMQHWKIFVKWNERLFHECYYAYLSGRALTNPVEGWYQGEIGFFDFYIIPLAKKLKECGVFGVTTDEYLAYAQANRTEWELKGKELVEQYLGSYIGRDDEDDPEAIVAV
jgi:class 3 adenylate cyclase